MSGYLPKPSAPTLSAIKGQSGAGMVPMHTGRIPNQWQHITAFIETLAQRDEAGQAQRRTALGAVSQAIPVGNHGDNRRSIK